MCDQDINPGRVVLDIGPTRRAFSLMTAAAAGVAADAQAAAAVLEKDVEVKTPDGQADAALYVPGGKGPWPAVLIWTDIFGLRPAFRDMGRRLAALGYVVLVPNPFYRSLRAPMAPMDFGNPEQRAKLMALRGAIRPESDAKAYLAFLDAQPQTDKHKKAGVQGYCMGGELSVRTAATAPGRIGAVASFHGGNGLATDAPDSPHRLIAKTHAAYLFATARNDDHLAPKVKDELKAALAEAKRPGVVEVYDADHGWCVKGSQVYNEAEAERAWAALTKLYKQYLV